MAGARSAAQRRAKGGTGFAQAVAEQAARERVITAIFIWLSDENEIKNAGRDQSGGRRLECPSGYCSAISDERVCHPFSEKNISPRGERHLGNNLRI